MTCKLVVRRFTALRDYIGDAVNSYPYYNEEGTENKLGLKVEPQGGAYVIIIVSDCEYDDPAIQELISYNMNPTTHNKIYGLRPISEGEEFFDELFVLGRITVTLAQLLTYKVKH